MFRNVWEWCEDYYQDGYKGLPTDGSANLNFGERKYRVIRGGSWGSVPSSFSTVRNWDSPANRYNINGFRVAARPR